jgi:hypothetical protein
MTTRVVPSATAPSVQSLPTAHRTTAVPTRPFQAVMSAGASAVIEGAEGAVRRLPGGPILAAAFRPVSSTAPTATAALAESPALTPEGRPAAGTAPGEGLEGALASHADQNLYFIALQERISAENRTYSAYSNILRVRHETMKNAIGNFR